MTGVILPTEKEFEEYYERMQAAYPFPRRKRWVAIPESERVCYRAALTDIYNVGSFRGYNAGFDDALDGFNVLDDVEVLREELCTEARKHAGRMSVVEAISAVKRWMKVAE